MKKQKQKPFAKLTDKQQAKYLQRQKFLKLRKNWKKVFLHGDITALAEQTGKSKQTISYAINHAKGSIELLEVVELYFAPRIPVEETA